METLNASTVAHSEDFQADLMAAILNTFQMDGEADLEHADNFDEINARFSELANCLVKAPAYQLAVDELGSATQVMMHCSDG
ncbi:MAG: hypothetical protein KME42_21130 [Tildeniella nuda ZEHNDER 1965/U140]|jgi:hypothetical protein|nr:hypothetical protein [Tildeniella nuda ZEHNDER 1965/U140]